jgi:transposase
MEKGNTFVGMDVHKETIDIAIAEGGRDGEVRHYGTIGGDLESLDKVVKKLRAKGQKLHFVYEAGPCGFHIYRHLTGQGEDCAVVSPSMIPKRSGDRVKTDRRDADGLARLHRAGELTAIYVPGVDDEAIRDLVRAREDSVYGCTQAKQRLKALLLRHGIRYRGKANWSMAHRRWLAGVTFAHPAQQIALQEYVGAVEEAERRVERLEGQVRELIPAWRMAAVVEALQALRGVSFVTAAGLVAEIGDIGRFDNPRELMAYLGLVPTEYSSGPSTRRGAITKAGNPHARRLLAESAWAYQATPRVGRQMLRRQENLSPAVRAIAWKAQLRLTGRFHRLVARGKAKPKVATAVARELCGFVWAIAREINPRPEIRNVDSRHHLQLVPVRARASEGLL